MTLDTRFLDPAALQGIAQQCTSQPASMSLDTGRIEIAFADSGKSREQLNAIRQGC